MRAAVYNRFWPSLGGGERHSGRLAQTLAGDGWKVDLVGHGGVDVATVADRLGLDLTGVRMRDLPDRGDAHVTEVSAEYDLFVNASYMSRVPARARWNVYLCYFPTPFDHDLSAWRRWVVRRAGRLARTAPTGFTHGTGWYPPEGGARRTWTWTNGEGFLYLDDGAPRLLIADIGRPGAPAPAAVTVRDAKGNTLAELTATPEFRRVEIRLPEGPAGTGVSIGSEIFVPGRGDSRELGVAVSRLRLGTRPTLAQRVGGRWPWLLIDPDNLEFLSTYDRVLANSEYTRGWIRRLWHTESEVLFPPIRLDAVPPAAARDPLIVTVGRFFAPGYGHSKRQLEMVQFFGRLVRSGRLPGWRLAVVGGCERSQEPYLEKVRAAAAGLPVDVIPNAPRATVDDLLARAAIFWSATGFGEPEQRRPWTLEHFGMTTVEAMSGGAVPVVIDLAGQREIVRDGIDGFRWRSPDELFARTVEVAGDEQLRARLAGSALNRAREFSDDAFVRRWHEIAARLELPLP